MNSQNENNIYTIPPNFIGTGTFLGGMFKMRNTVEAAIVAAVFGISVFAIQSLSLKMKIIILCMLISEEESLKMDGITLLYILEILNIRGMLIEPPVEVEQALEQLHKLYIAQEDLKE